MHAELPRVSTQGLGLLIGLISTQLINLEVVKEDHG